MGVQAMIGLQRKPGGGFQVVRIREQVYSPQRDIETAKGMRDSYDHQMAANIKRCSRMEEDNEEYRQAIIAIDKFIANPEQILIIAEAERDLSPLRNSAEEEEYEGS